MPHSTKSARSAFTGLGPKARPYKQGQSPARTNTSKRAKVTGSTAAPPPGFATRFHMKGANFAAKPRGPKQIRFASPEQAETFYAGPYPLMASGGYGSGKTFGLCLKAMYLSSMYPGNRGAIFRKHGNKLEKTTMKTFFKVCPPEAYQFGRRSDQAKTLVLNNGSEILWSQLDDSEILELLRGLEINWFIIDQAEEVSEEIIEVLMRRLGRWDQAEVPQHLIDAEHAAGREWPWVNKETGAYLPPTYAMFACNPDHELHWIYRRFHPDSPEWKETYSKQGYRMIMFDSTKNIFLPEQNKDLLLQGTKEFVARFVRGEWGIPEGQIHKIDPMSLLKMTPELENHLKECKLSRTLDHGETSPTCCVWWALDRWGNLFAYREYYQPDRLISFHRQRIYEMSLRKVINHIAGQRTEEWVPEQYVSELADPSIFNPRLQRGNAVSVAQEYMEVNEEQTDKHNAIFWDRADNNELGTRNRINELLALDPEHKHPLTGKKGAPRLYFVEQSPEYPQGCRELIRETRSARRVKIGTQDGRDIFSDERDDSIVDHAYDCFSGDTRVITPGGLVRFDELPAHGQVLTPRGWDYYFGAQKYRVDCELVRVRVSAQYGFQDVICTPDHLFMSKAGRWIPAAQLLGMQLDAFVPAEVTSVEVVSRGDSWCLTVDNTMHHSFCIEGGIVVHNCLRYRCADMDALPVEAVRRPPPGSVAHTIAEMKKESKRAARPRGDGTSRALDLARLPPQLASYYRRKVS